MGMRSKGATRLIGAAALGVAMIASGEASAQQVISAVEVEIDGPNETTVNRNAGGTAGSTTAGTDTRATTDYGVNKIFARGTASNEVYASSSWLDSFTVGGTGMVHLSFTFSVDGVVSGNNPSSAWNYTVAALRNDGWTLNGSGGSETYNYGRRLYIGEDYDTMILERATASTITRADMRDFDGFNNYTNVNGDIGNFTTRAIRGETNLGEYYEATSVSGFSVIATRFYANFYQRSTNGGPFQTFSYDASNPGGPQALAAYNNIKANYSLLAVGGLCAGECSTTDTGITVIDPFTFTLEFDLMAGSKFSLASWLYADDVDEGTVDFYNTAKVTGASVSAGGSLTSASGALTALPGGGYGYPGAVSGVPEPATWAMMIMGFGLIGGAMRRRQATPLVHAA